MRRKSYMYALEVLINIYAAGAGAINISPKISMVICFFLARHRRQDFAIDVASYYIVRSCDLKVNVWKFERSHDLNFN